MKVKEAITLFRYQQKANLKQRTIYSYNYILKKFETRFKERSIDAISADEMYQFLESYTEGYSISAERPCLFQP